MVTLPLVVGGAAGAIGFVMGKRQAEKKGEQEQAELGQAVEI